MLPFEPLFSDKHSTVECVFKHVVQFQGSACRLAVASNRGVHAGSPCNTNTTRRDNPVLVRKNFNATDFRKGIDTANVSNLLIELSACCSLSNVNQSVIDGAVDRVCNEFLQCAEKCNVLLKNKRAYCRYRSKRAFKKPWYNYTCMLYRKKYFRARRMHRNRNTHVTSYALNDACRNYRKVLRVNHATYYKNLNKKIKRLKSLDPSQYWAILTNGSDGSMESLSDTTIRGLFRHFEDLNKPNVSSADYEPNASDSSCVSLNDNPISGYEISQCIKKLKRNKAHGYDMVLNEFIIATKDIFLPVYRVLFNLIMYTGIFPSKWCIGVIKPIYKKKGSIDDPDSYRPITLVSCFCKLFTSVINARLELYVQQNGIVGVEQAGFRRGFSTIDHVFALQNIIQFYTSLGRRLYCCFVDYKKAFDTVDRCLLLKKLIDIGVDNRLVRIIFNMYKDAKSMVQCGQVVSKPFVCGVGLRQGEVLSPLLFAIYLYDLNSYFAQRLEGLTFLRDVANLHFGRADLDVLCSLFVLLYADDTVVMAETADDLNISLNKLADYCEEWKLEINADKTKIVIFSRGKVRIHPNFHIGNNNIDVVDSYRYLGIVLSYNGKYSVAIKHLCSAASGAMYSVLAKMSTLHLDVDTVLHLFNTCVKPVMLYGCEVWADAPSYVIQMIERVQLKFCKLLLKLHQKTPSVMVLGECGMYPVAVDVNIRAVMYWLHLKQTSASKISKAMLVIQESQNARNWLSHIKDVLNSCGLSHVWMSDGLGVDRIWLKEKLKLCLQDQHVQTWRATVENSSSCILYKHLKTSYCLESYLVDLTVGLRVVLCRFRCRNVSLPVVNAVLHQDICDNKCQLCCSNAVGDEFHYIVFCDYFNNARTKLLPKYFTTYPTVEKMCSLLTISGPQRTNVCKFILIVYNALRSR